jgi:hypothetical protein
MYDGSFNSVIRPGTGVTAALLFRNGIRVFSEVTLAEAEEHLFGGRRREHALADPLEVCREAAPMQQSGRKLPAPATGRGLQ